MTHFILRIIFGCYELLSHILLCGLFQHTNGQSVLNTTVSNISHHLLVLGVWIETLTCQGQILNQLLILDEAAYVTVLLARNEHRLLRILTLHRGAGRLFMKMIITLGTSTLVQTGTALRGPLVGGFYFDLFVHGFCLRLGNVKCLATLPKVDRISLPHELMLSHMALSYWLLLDWNLRLSLFALCWLWSIFQKGLSRDAWHYLVVVLKLLWVERMGHVFSTVPLFLRFLLLSLYRNHLLDLILHLHDRIHHCHLSCGCLLLMSIQTLLNKF